MQYFIYCVANAMYGEAYPLEKLPGVNFDITSCETAERGFDRPSVRSQFHPWQSLHADSNSMDCVIHGYDERELAGVTATEDGKVYQMAELLSLSG
jgi:hypothetical protein